MYAVWRFIFFWRFSDDYSAETETQYSTDSEYESERKPNTWRQPELYVQPKADRPYMYSATNRTRHQICLWNGWTFWSFTSKS